MSQAPLAHRLELLERRLAELERRLAVRDGTPSTPVVDWMASGAGNAETAARPVKPASMPERTASPGQMFDAAALAVLMRAPLAGPDDDRPAREPRQRMSDARQSAPATPPASLESIIGGRGLPIAGAGAFIIGVGFLVTLAVRDGWFGRLPPMVKCGAGGLLGIGLLVAAAIVSRRVSRWAASGLNAAGLGALYVSAWAAWGLYALVSPPAAFAMLAGCALLGLGIAARSRYVEVAIVSLVGGYIAPLLVGEREASPLVMPVYLLSLLVVGLGLSWKMGGAFAALRTITLVATAMLGTFWALTGGPDGATIVVGFLGATWAAFHAEMIMSSRRDDLRFPQSDAVESEMAPPVGPAPRSLDARTAVPVVSSFALTAWVCLLGVWAINRVGPNADWSITGGFAVAAVLVSLVLAGHLRFLVDRPGTRQEQLGAALAAQAGGLVAATIALGLGGWTQLCAWAAVGAAGAVAAGWLRSKPLAWYAAALLGAATVRLIGLEAFDPGLTVTGIGFFGLWLTRWALLAGACAAAWSLLAIMAATRGLGRALGGIGFAAATASWLIVPVHASALGSSVAAAWIVMGLGGLLWARRTASPAALASGLSAIVLGTSTLLGQFATSAGAAPGVQFAGLYLSKWTGLWLVAAAVWVLAGHVLARHPGRASKGSSIAACAVATGAVLLAWTHPRADAGTVCVAWLVASVAASALHPLARHLAPLLWGTVLLGASLAAWAWAFVVPGTWLDHAWPLGIHPGILVGAALAGLTIATARWAARLEPAACSRLRGIEAANWIAATLAFIATSHEAARAAARLAADPTAQAATLTLWWALFATALLGFGFLRKNPGARWAGLAVLGAAALKAVAYDMAGVALAWRVVVFMALGAIMLGIALVYARQQRPGVGPATEPA